MTENAEPEIAERDWFVEALVEFVADTGAGNVHGYGRDWKKGDRVNMIQWGREGRQVSRMWWTSYDIDGALIVQEDAVRVIKVNRQVPPR